MSEFVSKSEERRVTTMYKEKLRELQSIISEQNRTILDMEAREKMLVDAIKPFMEIIDTTQGRIPTERISFANWHDLIKAYNAIPDKASPESDIEELRRTT